MLAEILKKLIRQEDLTANEAIDAMSNIMIGQAGEVKTAAILTALSIKGETGVEIESFARAMRQAALDWPGHGDGALVDTCGTGGDSLNTINISTLSALLLASMDGLKVAKHGNRAVSSSTGSADLLEQAGVSLEMDVDSVVQCLNDVGITFLFAPLWHPAMKHAVPVRKALGVRTVFNILGPLTNPAPVEYQALGVYSKDLMEPMARALAGLGRKGAYVIHGQDGLDEVSIEQPTDFKLIRMGEVVQSGVWTPEDFGFERAPLSSIQVQNREESVSRAMRILEGNGTREENVAVAMNAALVHALVHRTDDVRESAGICMDQLVSGAAKQVLDRWAAFVPGKRG